MTKTFFKISLCILCLVAANRSLCQFREIHKEANASSNITGMSFINPSTGFVTFSNFVGFTTDSGRTFTKSYVTYANTNYNGYLGVNLTFGFSPSGVKAFSQDSVLIFGDYGTEPSILFSANRGQTWKLVYHEGINLSASVLNAGITDVEFPGNSNYGYAVHHERVLKTTNRGQTWSPVLNATNQELKELSFPSLNVGFAVGDDKIYKTSNGGTSWTQIASPDAVSTAPVYENVFFTNDLNGYVTQSFGRKIFRTTDGGQTWKKMNDETLIPVAGSDVYFTNDSTGFLTAGYAYEVLKTSDYGTTWEPCKRNSDYQDLYYGLNAITFLNSNIGWAGGGAGYMMITTSGALQTVPVAYFNVDTINESVTGKVNLLNFSKKNYQYKWIVNGTLVSSSYNSSYTHDLYKETDTIQLIVSNGIDSDTASTTIQFSIPVPPLKDSGWTVMATNINDDLSDVRFFGKNGIVIGKKGLYYTITGAADATGWKKYKITTSVSDSLLLEKVRFTALAFTDRSPVFYACGNDTINNNAIIIEVNLDNMNYSFKYIGTQGTHLNAMAYVQAEYQYKGNIFAVGRGGLKVIYHLDNYYTSVSYQNDGKDLISVFRRGLSHYSAIVGMISDSTFYTSDIEGVTNYIAPLHARGIQGAHTGGNATDMVISNKTLHYYETDQYFYYHDSITKIKAANLAYNCIASAGYPNGSSTYIGTDSGIYRVIGYRIDYDLTGNEVIEYQPSSSHKKISKIWFKQEVAYDTGYACGPNGTLLSTFSYGGADMPYSEITSSGNCLGDYTFLSGYHGSGSNCAWYLDDKFIQNNCSGFNTTINALGSHTLKYIVSNEYGYADTSVETIFINPVPATDLPFQISDSILCKSESILISIANTQAGFKYELIQELTGQSFGFATSSGGQLYVKTLPISVTGNYYIRVSSINSSCSTDFAKRLFLTVEHTKSAFTMDKFNIIPEEKVNFFNRSNEAQSYHWIFNGDANPQFSDDVSPSGISFTTAGQKTLSLISTSSKGCIDTLQTNSVFVYAKPIPDDVCFGYNLLDTNAVRGYTPVHKSVGTPDGGYLVAGSGDTAQVKSRFGISPYLNNNNNALLAKYTTDGALQWVVYNNNGGDFNSTTVDKDGNIYFTGSCLSNTFIHFSNGDSVRITSDTNKWYTIGFIVKITSAGKFVWFATVDDPSPLFQGYPVQGGIGTNISVLNNNILITGRFLANLSYSKNGTTKQLFALPNSVYENDLNNNYVLKLKDDGTLLWYTYFVNGSTNEFHAITGASFDKYGNAFISGYYAGALIVNDYNNAHSVTFQGNGGQIGYLLKFDPNGGLLWNTRVINNLSYKTAMINDMIVDSVGNCYLTGSSTSLDSTTSLQIVNSDGNISDLSVSTYFLVKFNSNGQYQWGAGSQYAYYGGGYALSLKEADLYAAGVLYNDGISSSTFTLTSTSGKEASLTIAESEFFVAQYNTSGVLLRVAQSGANVGGHLYPVSIIRAANNNLVIVGNTDNFNGGGKASFKIFKNKIKTPGGPNNFIVKVDNTFCNSSIIVLPATILSFQGALKNDVSELTWKVGEELNVGYYNVQRSSNGTYFSTIGSVQAQNGNLSDKIYHYSDPLSTLSPRVQTVYYRLEIVDKDGNKKYSNIINLHLETYMVEVAPNPNVGHFGLKIRGHQPNNEFVITIRDLTGKTLLRQNAQLQGSYFEKWYTLNLARGVYIIEIDDNVSKTVKKLIIQ